MGRRDEEGEKERDTERERLSEYICIVSLHFGIGIYIHVVERLWLHVYSYIN